MVFRPITKFGPIILITKRLTKFDKILDANFITTDPNSIDFKINNPFFIPNPADEAFEVLKITNMIVKKIYFFNELRWYEVLLKKVNMMIEK